MTEFEVYIDLYGDTRPIGLARSNRVRGTERILFEYDAEWLESLDRFSLEPALALTRGAFAPPVRVRQLLLEQTELKIAGVGKLTIKPGGTDVADLLRQQQRLEKDRDDLLQHVSGRALSAAWHMPTPLKRPGGPP